MRYRKTLNKTLRIPNPIQFCQGDLRESCLRLLSSTLTGRNDSGCLIVEVVSVVRHSMVEISNTNLSGEGIVHVQIECTVEQLLPNEIITGIKITRTDPSVFFFNEERRVDGGLLKTGIARALQPGNSIALVVKKSRYDCGKSHIAVNGEVLTCRRDFNVYSLSRGLSKAEAARLRSCLSEYKKELELRSELFASEDKQKALMFFENLYYSYKNPLSAVVNEVQSADGLAWKGPTGFRIKNSEDLLALLSQDDFSKVTEFYWARPLEVFQSSPLIVRVGKGSLPKDWEPRVVEQPAEVVFSKFIFEMESHCRAMRQLAEEFDSRSKISAQMNVWRLLQNMQAPAPKK